MGPMMRSRLAGRHCPVQGHGSRCEVSQDRGPRHRALEKREWRLDVQGEVA